jgi:vacuolar iron transporter family protein
MEKKMMMMQMLPESHRSEHIGWLRAAVLGANDGLLSTASLIVGVSAAQSSEENILLTGIAGLVAGALSMAAGEYVSVSSQADIENADLEREKVELATNSEFEHAELAQIYVERGLTSELAVEVAKQLMAHDALGSHARDELGITDVSIAKPIQAALASAAAFSCGAIFPLLMVFVSPVESLIFVVPITSILFLVVLGLMAARVGGACLWKGALRVAFWGVIAMGITAGIGKIFGSHLSI